MSQNAKGVDERAQDPIDQFRVPSVPTWSVSSRERSFLGRVAREAVRAVYPKMPLYLVDYEKTAIDPLLREAERRVWLPARELHAYVAWSPMDQLLTAFGLERTQATLVVTATSHLEELGVPEDHLYLLHGAVLYLHTDSGHWGEYEVASAHKRSAEAVLFAGDILNVALVATLRSAASAPNVWEGVPTELTEQSPPGF